MTKAVITGPTGVIGTALVRRLLAAGVEVYAVCRPQSPRVSHLPHDACLHNVECDLHELARLPELVPQPCQMFFHLGWLGTSQRANRFAMHLQVANIDCALAAAESAIQLGVQVFVGAGSQAEYGLVADGVLRPDTPTHPISGYGMAKLCAGQMTRLLCQQAGVRHIWVRPLSIYGPSDGAQTLIAAAIETLQAGRHFAMTAGEQMWDYLYAADAAEAFYQLALQGRDGGIYPLGSGQARPLREYVEIIRRLVAPKAAIGFGERPYLPDQVMHMEADIASLTADTGWQPQTSFAEGIRSMLAQS
ncbi:MAG: NAD(P)-dependent oxidoreductase [Selenomonadaceae bacterium]|nr:NAD(P)-dependent oxidoreductase [Selenomonadaceae bacterium]